MPNEVHHAPGDEPAETTNTTPDQWPLWEIFVRQRRGLAHIHAGSLHAPDVETALQNARDVYTRRSEGVSVWVVQSSQISSFDPDEAADYFDTNTEDVRSAAHYDIPDEVGHM